MLTCLHTLILLGEVAQIAVDIELVWVWIWSLGLP
jgi:hypothetical protein